VPLLRLLLSHILCRGGELHLSPDNPRSEIDVACRRRHDVFLDRAVDMPVRDPKGLLLLLPLREAMFVGANDDLKRFPLQPLPSQNRFPVRKRQRHQLRQAVQYRSVLLVAEMIHP